MNVWSSDMAPTHTPDYLYHALGITAAIPTIRENCGLPVVDWKDLPKTTYPCGTVFEGREVSAAFNRFWSFKDQNGNTSFCEQTIYLKKSHLFDISFPRDTTIACNDTSTHKFSPYVNFGGRQLFLGRSPDATVYFSQTDEIIPVCDGTHKIIKKYFVLDACMPTGMGTVPVPYENPMTYTHIIKVEDHVAPVVSCPDNITVSTDPIHCCSVFDLPDVLVSDKCSRIADARAIIISRNPETYEVTATRIITGRAGDFPGNNLWDTDTLAIFDLTPCLPEGVHDVRYDITDACGNTVNCEFIITMKDYTPPVAICDKQTIVTVGDDDQQDCYFPDLSDGQHAGVAWIKAKTLDDGTYDECGHSIKFTVQRMRPYSSFIQNLNNKIPKGCTDTTGNSIEYLSAVSQGDSLKVYCGEIGTTQLVVLRAWQINSDGTLALRQDNMPIFNECMVQLTVQDKERPTCIPPASVTVSCLNFDPALKEYGLAAFSDNCCLDSTKIFQGVRGLTCQTDYTLFDTVCEKGTLTRLFRVFDCSGNSTSCTQNITVSYTEDYYVRFPDDRLVIKCDGITNPVGPRFLNEDCELLAVSFRDDTATSVPDACFIVTRTWKIINWCTYDPNCPLVYVPNPREHALTNSSINLVGPIISSCTEPTVNWAPTKIFDADKLIFNYCSLWRLPSDCSTKKNHFNGYEYRQLIRVYDSKRPIPSCMAPDSCDTSVNDSLLWSGGKWWDPLRATHDLAEGTADVQITATDACSGSNVRIRYLLFLDIDADGVLETVVNSGNPPPPGRVMYGNAFTRNYTGGEERIFDHRNVADPLLDAYQFTIEITRNSAIATASVRFNTKRNPTVYLPAQLPYGRHQFRWIIEDGCTIETTCSQLFPLKDCKKPTIVCKALTVNLMNNGNGFTPLWAADFVEYAFDNIDPANRLSYAIIKASESTGKFPTDVNGQPSIQIGYTCAELGTQLVQVWVRDLTGNADFCTTYTQIQDNNAGICGTRATVAGVLQTEKMSGVEEGNIQLEGTHPALPPTELYKISDQKGHYQFSNAIPFLSDYTIRPHKQDNPLNGVTTLDLSAINRHILGTEPLSSPYAMIAADANRSGTISTLDIVTLRRLILGISDSLPGNYSWRFIDRNFVFPDQGNPFKTPFPETKTIKGVVENRTQEHFVGVKIGDVNQSAITNSAVEALQDRTTVAPVILKTEEIQVKKGVEYNIQIAAQNEVSGLQFTLQYMGLQLLDCQPGAAMRAEHIAVFSEKNIITVAWDGQGIPILNLKFRAECDAFLSNLLQINSAITRCLAYNNNTDIPLPILLQFDKSEINTHIDYNLFDVYQCLPNPFYDHTLIPFYLPESASAQLTIYDALGQSVHQQKGIFQSGRQYFKVDRLKKGRGECIYFYTVQALGKSKTMSMTME